jgi:hypothetical protein
VHNEIIDKEGNYLILDITIQEYRITLVALYGPNNDSPKLPLIFIFLFTMSQTWQEASM